MYAHTHACSNIFGSLFSCCYRQLTHTHTHKHRFTHTDPHTEVDTDIQEGRVWQGFAFCEENGVETEMKQWSMENDGSRNEATRDPHYLAASFVCVCVRAT